MSTILKGVEELYIRFKYLLKKRNFAELKDFLSNISDIDSKYEKSIKDRKKKGAFYTERELADYISRETIEWYNSKQESQLKNFQKLNSIKILDPACGSGIFLISIADMLFNLLKTLSSKIELPPYKDFEDWEFKVEIINNNIYGMDVDSSALKICEMNLASWIFDSISQEKLSKLSINLNFQFKNQNFLINTKEKSEFDIILGNPPYGNILSEGEKEILKSEKIFTSDIYVSFLLKSLRISRGIIGFLIPKSFLLRQNYIGIRSSLLENSNIYKITDVGSNIFKGATNEVQIFLYEKLREKRRGSDENLTSVLDLTKKWVINYKNHEFDQLKICDQNSDCELYDKQRRFFVYTFENNCQYCNNPTRNLNRIRIKLDLEKKAIIDYIEKNSNLNYLNIKDFKMVRGEEEGPLKEIRKLVQNKGKLVSKNEYFLLNAKNDIENFKIRKRKVVDLSKITTKKDIKYYRTPKLLIKHNTIYPVTVYVEEKAIFTSSVYSLLGKEEKIKTLSLLFNSKLMKFYCIYAINNQNDTTINLNQYMIRHLPFCLPGNFELTSKLYDILEILIENENISQDFFKEFVDLITYQLYFAKLRAYPNFFDIFQESLGELSISKINLEGVLKLKEIIAKNHTYISTKNKIYINPWVKEISKV